MLLRRPHPEGFQRCPAHPNSWHKPSAGCAVCRSQRLAYAKADAATARRGSLSDLIAEEQALTERATQRARATIASIDATLAADEAQRAHERRVYALGQELFAEMTGAR